MLHVGAKSKRYTVKLWYYVIDLYNNLHFTICSNIGTIFLYPFRTMSLCNQKESPICKLNTL